MSTVRIIPGFAYPVLVDGERKWKLMASEWPRVPDAVEAATGKRVREMQFDGDKLNVWTKRRPRSSKK